MVCVKVICVALDSRGTNYSPSISVCHLDKYCTTSIRSNCCLMDNQLQFVVAHLTFFQFDVSSELIVYFWRNTW